MENKDEEFMSVITDKLEEDYKKFLNIGLMAGWDSCCKALYAQCKNLTSAKAIKQLLKSKCDEADERIKVNKSEPTDTNAKTLI